MKLVAYPPVNFRAARLRKARCVLPDATDRVWTDYIRTYCFFQSHTNKKQSLRNYVALSGIKDGDIND